MVSASANVAVVANAAAVASVVKSFMVVPYCYREDMCVDTKQTRGQRKLYEINSGVCSVLFDLCPQFAGGTHRKVFYSYAPTPCLRTRKRLSEPLHVMTGADHGCDKSTAVYATGSRRGF